VHKHLGPGFSEAVYQEALCIEMDLRGIPFERQKAAKVTYKGKPVGEGKIDLLVGGVLIVELKAIEEFADVHYLQVISYLKMTALSLGLLINFNVTMLKDGIKRVVLS
jgi:GxxExxY protein